MKIAVTGATGHIGANLCRMLIERGHSVKALIHRSNIGLEGLPLEFLKGDVTGEDSLEDLCRDCEIIFHLAAHISIRKLDYQCRELNCGSCDKLIQAARKTGVRKIIHFSSIHAFSEEPFDSELNESRSLALESEVSYNCSKALSQRMMIEASSKELEITVLNPTAVIGPNDFKPSYLGNAIIRFYKGQNPGLIPGGYDWVDVRDVCTAAINAIELGRAGECYLLGGSWQSLKTLAMEIEKSGGSRPPRLELPMWIAQAGTLFLNLHSYITKKQPLYTSMSLQALKKSHRNISYEKARVELNYRSRPFSETISDAIQWYKENNYI
jgi:dihydroflavonol-4-reductase